MQFDYKNKIILSNANAKGGGGGGGFKDFKFETLWIGFEWQCSKCGSESFKASVA